MENTSFVCWELYVCLVQTVWQSPRKLTLATMMILIKIVLIALYSLHKVADQLSAVRSSFLMQIFIVGFVWLQRCLPQITSFLHSLTHSWWRGSSTLSQDPMMLKPVNCTQISSTLLLTNSSTDTCKAVIEQLFFTTMIPM